MNLSQVAQYDILMIDDDADLNSLVAEYLQRFGHRLTSAITAAKGMQQLHRELPDLIILDVMLPDTDGLTLCREIRRQFDVPIIMLTARGELADKVMGLEFGADDYLAKPFEPRELVARIQSIIRRTEMRKQITTLAFQGIRLEKESRSVSLNDKQVNLTSMEFELLLLLMENHGKVLSRNHLIERLRGIDADIYDRSVDMHICRLREKLLDDSQQPHFIRTIRSTGYQFIGIAN